MSEFWAAIAGAGVGGIATFWASSSQTKKVLRHERDMVKAATAREAAVLLLEALARMRANIDSIGEVRHVVHTEAFYRRLEEQPTEASGALEEITRLDTSRAQLLPEPLSRSWYELTLLLGEYRNALRSSEKDAWPGPKLNRSGADVLAYMAFVGDALAEFVRSGWVTKARTRPVLRRDDLETWSWGDDSDA